MKQLFLVASLLSALAACHGPSDEGGSLGASAGASDPGGGGAPGGTGGAPCGALDLGRCTLAGTAQDCTDQAGDHEFTPLAPGDSVTMILGPQGSMMFVFAARTTDIDPIAASLDIKIYDTASAVTARYRAHADFTPEPGTQATFIAPSLFVIIEGTALDLAGEALRAEGYLEDSAGQCRSGEASFVAGL